MNRKFFLLTVLLCMGILWALPDPSKNQKSKSSIKKSLTTNKTSCSTGCAALEKLELPFLKFQKLMETFSKEKTSKNSLALETLLFYGENTRKLLANYGYTPLSKEKALFLQRELTRKHAKITMKLIDEKGVVRAQTGPTLTVLGAKTHFQVRNPIQLQPFEFNGTIKRVGVHHLWMRM